jgi:hypothetical protein
MNNKIIIGIMALGIAAALCSTLAMADDTDNPPDNVKLDKLQNLYKPTNFDHKVHLDVAEKCETCHHKKGQSKSMACSGCHKVPFDLEALHVVGLKGALHQQCMGCHKKNDVADTCTSCHEKK